MAHPHREGGETGADDPAPARFIAQLPQPAKKRPRRFGRLEPRVRRIVSIAFVDPSPSVREKARSAALDLRTFLRWELEEG